MVWRGCLNTRLEKLFLPLHLPSCKLHKVCGKLLACNLFMYSSFSMCPAWDTHLFYCDTLSPCFIAPECLPCEVESQGEVPGHQRSLHYLLSCLSCPFVGLLSMHVRVHWGREERGEVGDIHWLGCASVGLWGHKHWINTGLQISRCLSAHSQWKVFLFKPQSLLDAIKHGAFRKISSWAHLVIGKVAISTLISSFCFFQLSKRANATRSLRESCWWTPQCWQTAQLPQRAIVSNGERKLRWWCS